MNILCVFGKYQYGDCTRGLGTEYTAFIPALKNLGHNVIHFESWDRSLYKDYAKLNQSLLKTIFDIEPDIIFVVQMNYEIWIDTLKIVKQYLNAITICWTTDDSWKYRQVSRFIGHHYDVMTTTYPDVMSNYYNDGINSVQLTQWAVSEKFLVEPIPANQCIYPVSFVGMAYGERKRTIQYLQDRGVEIHCFGHGWPNGSVEALTMREIIKQSIISLNFSKSSSLSFKSSYQIKARTFEVPGYGGFLLTEHSNGLEKHYEIGRELDVFSSKEELLSKIRFYLENLEIRDAVAKQGFCRTKEDHTYEKRLSDILTFAETLQISNSAKILSADYMNELEKAIKKYEVGFHLKIFRQLILFLCSILWGIDSSPKAARRILFEFSWRFFGKETFTATGLPGRLFPMI